MQDSVESSVIKPQLVGAPAIAERLWSETAHPIKLEERQKDGGVKSDAGMIGSAAAATPHNSDTADESIASIELVPQWRKLTGAHKLWPADGAQYYSFKIAEGSLRPADSTEVHLVVANLAGGHWTFKPLLNSKVQSTSRAANPTDASAAVNGGYFNAAGGGGRSVSYVTVDGKVVADPKDNPELMNDPKLKPYLPAILNRSEVRLLKDDTGKAEMQIAHHNDPVPQGFKIAQALQSGPQLLPDLTVSQEAFERRNPDGSVVDSIRSKQPAARTAFGITADGYGLVACVAGSGQDPESSGLSLAKLAQLMKSLGCTSALNFDGGASSTMFVRLAASASPSGLADGSGELLKKPPGAVVCAKNPETMVKSIWLLEHQ